MIQYYKKMSKEIVNPNEKATLSEKPTQKEEEILKKKTLSNKNSGTVKKTPIRVIRLCLNFKGGLASAIN